MALRRRTRIALRWAALFVGLGSGSVGLLLVYGVALVDSAMLEARSGSSTRVLSAPLRLASGDPWGVGDLERVLADRRVPRSAASRPDPGEFAAANGSIWLGEGLVLGDPAPVEVILTGRRPRLRSGNGVRLSEVYVRPAVLGAGAPNDIVRWPVGLDAMAPHLLTAVVDVEDQTFLTHPGLSLRGLLRAAAHDLFTGGTTQGGSTITQQLAKVLMLKPARNVARKVLEAWLAALLEYRYDKRTILETYLNRIYLGQDRGWQIQGVEAAAQYYVGKRAAELDEAESALLAGLIAAPNRFDPLSHPEAARRRRSAVLTSMVRQGHLAPSEAELLASRPLPEAARRLRWGPAAQVVELVIESHPGAGDVVTSVEVEAQRAVYDGTAAGLALLEARYDRLRALAAEGDALQAAVVVMQSDGRILAALGSRRGEAGEFNRAFAARRQIGSLVKPFVVAEALSAGHTLDDPLSDEALAVPTGSLVWRPENSDGRFRGIVSVREALVLSLNVPMVRLGLELSVARVGQALRRLGFSAPTDTPAILLGAVEASPVDVARAYAALIGGGRLPEPTLFPREADRHRIPVIDPGAAGAVVEVLGDVVRRGTAAGLGPSFADGLAAKTGTTDGRRDSWFVALRPRYVTVIWLGTDGNRETGLFGATGAMEVWREIDRRLPQAWRR